MGAEGAVLRTLVHIQAHLDSDLNLDTLSRLAAMSPYHFQRLFARATGETPKRYVARLRLERAAFRIRLQNAKLLEIALDCGYQNHETFTRAFRRHFGIAPSRYRVELAAESGSIGRRPSAGPGSDYALSEVTIRNLRPAHLAFIRHTGSYAEVPQRLFDSLRIWAGYRGLAQPPIWMGLGHDAPSTTPPAHQRFDAAIVVPDRFEATGPLGYQHFAGGYHAIATHVGPYASLEAAYSELLPSLLTLRGYRLVGLPVLEIYQTDEMRTSNPLSTTELCFPVEPV